MNKVAIVRTAIAGALALVLAVGVGTAGWASYRVQLNPAEGGTSSSIVTACAVDARFKAFSSEVPGLNYAYTKDYDAYCDYLGVRVHYVASNGSWAGWTSWDTASGSDNVATITVTGDLQYSLHEGD
ncbi:hypothetical protein [Demequina sp.]|uniref:hypothetical protein n=1 Tax=Demequina sp. TaxID=2050685 RepID=UPI003D0FDD1C